MSVVLKSLAQIGPRALHRTTQACEAFAFAASSSQVALPVACEQTLAQDKGAMSKHAGCLRREWSWPT